MKTSEILNEAKNLVDGDRHKDYGDKTENHKNIAKLWSAYLDTKVEPHDVAIMMALLKMARIGLDIDNIVRQFEGGVGGSGANTDIDLSNPAFYE